MEDGHPNVRTALENTIDTYKRAWNGENPIKVIESDFKKLSIQSELGNFDY